MVALPQISASNALISTALPAGLVAVFVGATNGVGETTVRQFAKYAVRPRVYIVGRSREAGERIRSECAALNPKGTFVFLRRDLALMREVDGVCEEIGRGEERVNVLFLSVGTLEIGGKTDEGLHYAAALTVYARHRFITNILPLLQRAEHLRRVVSVYGATFEGPIRWDDFEGASLVAPVKQGHVASVTTLGLEGHHQVAPGVSFVHNFPGSVKSGIDRGSIGPLMRTLKTVFILFAPLVNIPLEEAGDRHLFLCTSARFANGEGDGAGGVPLVQGLTMARGSDGREGSGVYSIDAHGESTKPKVERLLAKMRGERVVERVRERIEADVGRARAMS